MTALLVSLIVSVFTIDYFAVKIGVISRFFTLVPDLIAAVIGLIVIGRLLVLRKWEQPKYYVWLLGAFIAICLVGLVAESVAPGVVVAGIRNYFKFLPLLFLPAVYRFSDHQRNIFVGTFLFMACIQVPLAFYQRFVQFAHRMHSGDSVEGMVSTSSALTLVLCVAIALVITLYLHRKIGLFVTLFLFGFLAAPTAINETKATVFLLPIATLLPFWLAKGVPDKGKKLVPVMALFVVGLIGFAITYNMLSDYKWWVDRDIFSFFTSGEFSGYLYRGSEVGREDQLVGRLDSIILPLKILADNWMQLLFGVGIGNASPSFLAGLTGEYADLAANYGFGKASIGNLLWEVGVLGLLIYFAIFAFVMRDAKRWATGMEPNSWIGTWWGVSIVLLFVALAYKPILIFNEISSLLFFWSGIAAAEAWQIRNRSRAASDAAHHRLQLAGKESHSASRTLNIHGVAEA